MEHSPRYASLRTCKARALICPRPSPRRHRIPSTSRSDSSCTATALVQLHARYGELLSSVFALRDGGTQGPRLERGSVRLGGGDAGLPDGEGMILSGSLPRPVRRQMVAPVRTGCTVRSRRSRRPLRSLRPPAGEPPGGGARRLRCSARHHPNRRDGRCLLHVDGLPRRRQRSGRDPGSGRLGAGPRPHGPAQRTRFRREGRRGGTRCRHLAESHRAARVSIHLRGMQAGRPCSRDSRHRRPPRPPRYPHTVLLHAGAGYEARGSATWLVSDGIHQSSVDAQIHSNDLGRLLGTFGHVGGESITGATDMLLRASWPGSPFDFDLGRLDGVLHFRASEGRLTQVRRGATGRFFGLLMLP